MGRVCFTQILKFQEGRIAACSDLFFLMRRSVLGVEFSISHQKSLGPNTKLYPTLFASFGAAFPDAGRAYSIGYPAKPGQIPSLTLAA